MYFYYNIKFKIMQNTREKKMPKSYNDNKLDIYQKISNIKQLSDELSIIGMRFMINPNGKLDKEMLVDATLLCLKDLQGGKKTSSLFLTTRP